MKQKWIEVEGGKSERIIQPLLDDGWVVKMMSAASFSGTAAYTAHAPGCFVYLTKEE